MEETVEITRKKGEKTIKTQIPYRRIGPKYGDGLRVPSLRGVLRFWFRAINGHKDSKQLFQEEAYIFGDTNSGQGLRLIPCGPDEWSVKAISGGAAEGYLGYGPLGFKDREFKSHNNNAQRDAIVTGSLFRFRALGMEKQQIDALKKCLVMLHLFGGIGSRSRRAWGSLSVTANATDTGNFIPPVDENNFEDWFIERLKFVFAKLPAHATSHSALTLDSDIRYFSVLKKSEESYRDILKEFFNQFKELRDYKTGAIGVLDVKKEHEDFDSSQLTAIPKRVAFGLPYQPGKTKEWALRYLGNDSPKIDRRASPLILKVLEGKTRLYGIALFLKTTSFFGNPATKIVAEKCEGEIKKDKWKPLTGNAIFNDWKAIDKFLAKKEWNQINLEKAFS